MQRDISNSEVFAYLPTFHRFFEIVLAARKSKRAAITNTEVGSYKIAKKGTMIKAGPKPLKPFTKYAVRIMRIPNIMSIRISNLESIIMTTLYLFPIYFLLFPFYFLLFPFYFFLFAFTFFLLPFSFLLFTFFMPLNC